MDHSRATRLLLALFGLAELIAVSWFAFTAAGLVGFGHYISPGALDMVWWRHANSRRLSGSS